MRETLGFEEMEMWFRAAVGGCVSIHVASPSGSVAFLDGPIDSVMGFESTRSHGLLVDGADGAWTLTLDETDFVSATLNTIPDSRTMKQLMIKMRDHWVVIDPGRRDRPQAGSIA